MNNIKNSILMICTSLVITACNGPTSHGPVSSNTSADKTSTAGQITGSQILGEQKQGSASSSDVISVSAASILSPEYLPPPVSLSLNVDRVASYVGNKVTVTTNYDHMRMLEDTTNTIMVNWKILDASDVVLLEQDEQHQIEWVPDTAGVFTVTHTIMFNDKEESVSETLYVLDPISQDADIFDRFWTMDEKILGVWSGHISSPFNENTNVSVVFYDDGTYAMSKVSQGLSSIPYPYLEPPRPPVDYDVRGGGGPGMPYFERYPYGDMYSVFFNKENGLYELLDIWANGEALGSMQSAMMPPMSSENMKRIRFNAEYDMLFFELSNDPFFSGNQETYVLSRVSDVAISPSLDVIKEKIAGDWKGNIMTPWAKPYEVSFQFNVDGTYQASSLTETSLFDGEDLGLISPFYFGADVQQNSAVTYNLDAFDQGLTSGEISLALKNGDMVTGTISRMEMSIDYFVLVFTFKHYGKYGPIQYVLERQ